MSTPRRQKHKPFDFDNFLKKAKLWAFDIGMAMAFFVMLYRVVMPEIRR